MSRRHVVLEISPSRLELAVVARRAVVTVKASRPPAELGERWTEGLAALAPTLAGWVAELSLRGASATVLYSSPDAHAGVVGVPAAIGGAAAREAARLALGDAVSFPVDLNPHDVALLGADAGAGGRVGADGQRRLLGVADTEASVAALHQLVAGAGLHVAALVPAAAALIADTLRQAALERADTTTLVVNLGEHNSVLAAVAGGRTRFIRTFAVGLESFTDALRRPIQSRRHHGEQILLDPEAARAIIFTAGIPRREDAVDAERGVDGAALLPLLQPVLQRCTVEIRQSLRFGLGDAERAAVDLRLLGFAAAIPRLGGAIAELTGEALRAGASAAEPASGGVPSSSQCGAIAALLRTGPVGVALLPGAVRGRRATRSLARALYAGTAAAACAVAVNAALTHSALRASEERLAALNVDAGSDPAMAAYARAVASSAAVTDAVRRVDAALSGSSDWAAVLATLADRTPAHVRLRAIDLLDDTAEGPRCRIRAFPAAVPGRQQAEIVKAYLDELASVPLVRSVKLGATGRAGAGEEEVQEFELVCDLVPLPRPRPAPGAGGVAAAATGDAP